MHTISERDVRRREPRGPRRLRQSDAEQLVSFDLEQDGETDRTSATGRHTCACPCQRIWRCRHFDGVSGEREYRSWHGILCRTRGEQILQMDGGGWWLGPDPDELVARGLEGIALADTGHPP